MIWVSILSVGLGSLVASDTPAICIPREIVYTGIHKQEKVETKWQPKHR
jgi:hypothetical protein